MEGRTYTLEAADAWQSWFDRLEGCGPYHSPAYLDVLAGDFEYASEFAELFVYGTEDAFVYYPYLRRPVSDLPFAADALDEPAAYSDVVSSWYYGGPLLSPDADSGLPGEFSRDFAEYCREAGIVAEFVRFDPNHENHRRFEALDPTFERETVRVDLTKSEETIWEEFETRNRTAIRRARETDLVVEPTADPADYEAFYGVYGDAMDAKDASRHYRFPLSFFEGLLGADDLASLVVARHDGEFVGGSLVVHDDSVAHDYLRATDPDYWDLRVNNLLCYEAMMAMRDRGRDRFDFQGGRPGVFRFKKGFSTVGRGEFYLGRRTHLPDVAGALTDAAAARGVDTDGDYFPPYRTEQSN